MDKTTVVRGNVTYYCTTEEQLKLFLSKGYSVLEPEKPKAEPEEKTPAKTTKKKK